jgi:chromate transporter
MSVPPDPAPGPPPAPARLGEPARAPAGRAREVFGAFLKLGCTAFGGPIAHLGYFQNEFVVRRKWTDDATYADIVALCQFLPGPTSSQVGFSLGWRRAGRLGALAAWIGFTLPSAILMIAFAYGVKLAGNLAQSGWVQGLKVAAVAVVAQAVWTMARKLCPDVPRAAIAVASAIALLLVPHAWMQIVVLAAGAVAGLSLARLFKADPAPPSAPVFAGRPCSGLGWLGLFFGLLLLLPWLAHHWPVRQLQMFNGFYRAGSLVFGGGHVLLPLLEKVTVGQGWLDHDTFLAGYGAAQALPGPLFTFSAYLGTIISHGGIIGGLLALLAIFLPSALLVFGALPQWDRLRSAAPARALLAGTNAAVVGLLGAAFYSPIWTSAITDLKRLALMLAAYAGLEFFRMPPWLMVIGCAAGGALALR